MIRPKWYDGFGRRRFGIRRVTLSPLLVPPVGSLTITMKTKPRIERPDDPTLNALCDELTELAPSLESEDAWPAHQLELCGRYGVFEWFISRELGAALHTVSAFHRKRRRLRRRTPGGSLVPRSTVLPGLELPAGSPAGRYVRTCWNRFSGVIYATSPELPRKSTLRGQIAAGSRGGSCSKLTRTAPEIGKEKTHE